MRERENLERTPRLRGATAGMLAGLVLAALGTGCSVKKMLVNKVGDALAESGTSYASDNDPELVRDAVPFGLKLMESLLEQSPKHRGLLLAASSGFTQYAYAFVQQDAEKTEVNDLAAGDEMRARARRLYLRARNYALRGLEAKRKGFESALRQDPRAAVLMTRREDVPLLYWAAASWGLAISISKDDPDLIADQLIVEALIDRALELDETYEFGAIHGFLISYEGARQGAKGDRAERARKHFERAIQLTKGQLAGPYVSLAESVSLDKQDRKEFESLLKQALVIDPDKKPEWRLGNLIMQRRARWLLGRLDELFLPEGGNGKEAR